MNARFIISVLLICTIIDRFEGLRGITPQQFHEQLFHVNNMVMNFCQSEHYIKYYVTKGFWQNPPEHWTWDGIHPNKPVGRETYKKAIRRAIFQATEHLLKNTKGPENITLDHQPSTSTGANGSTSSAGEFLTLPFAHSSIRPIYSGGTTIGQAVKQALKTKIWEHKFVDLSEQLPLQDMGIGQMQIWVRICVDLRKLNKCVVCEKDTLPTIDDVLHKMLQSTIFNFIDARSGWSLDDPTQRGELKVYYFLNTKQVISGLTNMHSMTCCRQAVVEFTMPGWATHHHLSQMTHQKLQELLVGR